jgi:hypothetical protein
MARNDLGIPAITKRVNQVGGVLRRRVLVKDTTAGQVKYPAAANAGALDGVTIDDAENGKGVPLYQSGYAEIEASAAIAHGAAVNVADATGRIKAVSEAGGTAINLVGYAEEAAGAAGDVIMVDIRQFGERYTA